MVTEQRPLGTGLGKETTAADVLSGVDVAGATFVVTGGYSGVGLAATRALAEAGAQVMVPARRPGIARERLARLPGVEVGELDLADLASIHRFADAVVASGHRIDAIIGAAAVMACPLTRVGPGWELQFATNHLGHYALVNRLWPVLAEGARVVVVSSGAHRHSAIRWDDIDFVSGYDKWLAYGQAKTANALFALHLDDCASQRGIRAFSVHPGGIKTPLQRHVSMAEQIELGWYEADGSPVDGKFRTPDQGAATPVWGATSAQLAGHGGVYLEDCDIAPRWEGGTGPGVASWACDREQAQRLWAVSAQRTGLNVFD